MTHHRTTHLARAGVAFALAATVALCAPAAAAAAERLPNIVIVFTDDQGYGDVGVFGAEGFETPNLDRLAADGVRLTHFRVAQAVCSASRTALLTGCYPNRVGIHGALGPGANHGIHPGEMTLAELVKQKGYATAIFGKWHLGHRPEFLPTRHGFDHWYGIPYSNDMWPHHPTAKHFPPLPLFEDEHLIGTLDDQAWLTTELTERAVRFIGLNKHRPFFLYLPHPQPHVPLFVSDKFKGKSEQGLYGDVMMELDWSVGEVMKALDRHGIADDTLVIFTCDNGPWLSYGDHAGSSGPLREGKGTSWEGGVREPFIARWPGKIPAGTVVDTPAMTIDLLPTIAGLIGAELPHHPIDGRDVWPVISGKAGATNPHQAYAIYYRQNELQALLSGDGRWKLYFPHSYRTLAGRPGGTGGRPARYSQNKVAAVELYDLHNDIGETENVAPAHPDVVGRLQKLAQGFRQDLGDRLTKAKGGGNRPPGRVARR